MDFVLFIMFFVTTSPSGNDRTWTLQSTQSMEFGSKPACDDVIQNFIIRAIQTTDTVSVFGWCFPKKTTKKGPAAFGLLPETAVSCYQYVPPEPGSDKRSTGPVVSHEGAKNCNQ
jgi:hypothetical protein